MMSEEVTSFSVIILLMIIGGTNMRKIGKRILSFLLILIMVFNLNSVVFASSNTDEYIVYNDQSYHILEKSDSVFSLKTENDNFEVIATLNYITREVMLVVTEKNNGTATSAAPYTVGNNTANYIVSNIIDEDIYSETFTFINVDTGEIYSSGEITPFYAGTIPSWMGLGKTAIEALLALGKAIIVGAVAWVSAVEIVHAVETSSYDYFQARRLNGDIYIGDGISRSQAVSIIKQNSSIEGVFCRTERIAYYLADTYSHSENGPYYDSNCNHTSDEEIAYYWPHYHPSLNSYKNTHIWFPDFQEDI